MSLLIPLRFFHVLPAFGGTGHAVGAFCCFRYVHVAAAAREHGPAMAEGPFSMGYGPIDIGHAARDKAVKIMVNRSGTGRQTKWRVRIDSQLHRAYGFILFEPIPAGLTEAAVAFARAAHHHPSLEAAVWAQSQAV